MPIGDALVRHGGSQIFSTEKFSYNHVSVTKRRGDERITSWGICGSMSARYITESLKRGAPLDDAGQIGTELNIGITQAAFKINGEGSMSVYLFDIFGLEADVTKVGTIVSWRAVSAVASELTGYVSFTIKGAGGHAMAFCLGNGTEPSYYFDPNCGAYGFPDKAQCTWAVANHMKAHYDKFKDGEYRLYQVSQA